MIRKVFLAFLLIVTGIQKGNARKVNCNENEFNAYKDWDCSDIEYYFTPEQVRQTLYCIDYNKNHGPSKALNYTEPTTLNLARNIVKFHDVIEDSREISFRESFLLDYFDGRLAFPNCNPNFMLEYDVKDMYSFLWFPKFQSAFSTIDATHSSLTSPNLIRFWPNSGRLGVINTITATVICASYDDTKMNFRHFPFDYHNCSIPIKLDYEKYYRDGSVNVMFNLFEHSDEISQNKLEHPDWKLGFSEHKIIIQEIPLAKRDKILRVPESIYSITLQREITSYYFHTFMPSLVLCLACTLSSFIHYDNMPARMSLVTSSCLSLITLFSGAK